MYIIENGKVASTGTNDYIDYGTVYVENTQTIGAYMSNIGMNITALGFGYTRLNNTVTTVSNYTQYDLAYGQGASQSTCFIIYWDFENYANMTVTVSMSNGSPLVMQSGINGYAAFGFTPFDSGGIAQEFTLCVSVTDGNTNTYTTTYYITLTVRIDEEDIPITYETVNVGDGKPSLSTLNNSWFDPQYYNISPKISGFSNLTDFLLWLNDSPSWTGGYQYAQNNDTIIWSALAGGTIGTDSVSSTNGSNQRNGYCFDLVNTWADGYNGDTDNKTLTVSAFLRNKQDYDITGGDSRDIDLRPGVIVSASIVGMCSDSTGGTYTDDTALAPVQIQEDVYFIVNVEVSLWNGSNYITLSSGNYSDWGTFGVSSSVSSIQSNVANVVSALSGYNGLNLIIYSDGWRSDSASYTVEFYYKDTSNASISRGGSDSFSVGVLPSNFSDIHIYADSTEISNGSLQKSISYNFNGYSGVSVDNYSLAAGGSVSFNGTQTESHSGIYTSVSSITLNFSQNDLNTINSLSTGQTTDFYVSTIVYDWFGANYPSTNSNNYASGSTIQVTITKVADPLVYNYYIDIDSNLRTDHSSGSVGSLNFTTASDYNLEFTAYYEVTNTNTNVTDTYVIPKNELSISISGLTAGTIGDSTVNSGSYYVTITNLNYTNDTSITISHANSNTSTTVDLCYIPYDISIVSPGSSPYNYTYNNTTYNATVTYLHIDNYHETITGNTSSFTYSLSNDVFSFSRNYDGVGDSATKSLTLSVEASGPDGTIDFSAGTRSASLTINCSASEYYSSWVITANPSSLSFSSSQETKTSNITCTRNHYINDWSNQESSGSWSISVSGTGFSGSKTPGLESSQVSITAESNSGAERQGTATISLGSVSTDISLSQAKGGISISFLNGWNGSYDDTVFTGTVVSESNSSWTVTASSSNQETSSISPNTGSGIGSTSITVTISDENYIDHYTNTSPRDFTYTAAYDDNSDSGSDYVRQGGYTWNPLFVVRRDNATTGTEIGTDSIDTLSTAAATSITFYLKTDFMWDASTGDGATFGSNTTTATDGLDDGSEHNTSITWYIPRNDDTVNSKTYTVTFKSHTYSSRTATKTLIVTQPKATYSIDINPASLTFDAFPSNAKSARISAISGDAQWKISAISPSDNNIHLDKNINTLYNSETDLTVSLENNVPDGINPPTSRSYDITIVHGNNSDISDTLQVTQNYVDYSISSSANSVVFPSTGGEQSITITSSYTGYKLSTVTFLGNTYNATDVATEDVYFTISGESVHIMTITNAKSSNAASNSITITMYYQNTSADTDLTGSITFVTVGKDSNNNPADSVQIALTEEKRTYGITASQLEEFEALTDLSQTLRITSQMGGWEIDTADPNMPDWISFSSTSASLPNDTFSFITDITVTATQNTDINNGRLGSFVIKNVESQSTSAPKSVTVSVSQKKATVFFLIHSDENTLLSMIANPGNNVNKNIVENINTQTYDNQIDASITDGRSSDTNTYWVYCAPGNEAGNYSITTSGNISNVIIGEDKTTSNNLKYNSISIQLEKNRKITQVESILKLTSNIGHQQVSITYTQIGSKYTANKGFILTSGDTSDDITAGYIGVYNSSSSRYEIPVEGGTYTLHLINTLPLNENNVPYDSIYIDDVSFDSSTDLNASGTLLPVDYNISWTNLPLQSSNPTDITVIINKYRVKETADQSANPTSQTDKRNEKLFKIQATCHTSSDASTYTKSLTYKTATTMPVSASVQKSLQVYTQNNSDTPGTWEIITDTSKPGTIEGTYEVPSAEIANHESSERLVYSNDDGSEITTPTSLPINGPGVDGNNFNENYQLYQDNESYEVIDSRFKIVNRI